VTVTIFDFGTIFSRQRKQKIALTNPFRLHSFSKPPPAGERPPAGWHRCSFFAFPSFFWLSHNLSACSITPLETSYSFIIVTMKLFLLSSLLLAVAVVRGQEDVVDGPGAQNIPTETTSGTSLEIISCLGGTGETSVCCVTPDNWASLPSDCVSDTTCDGFGGTACTQGTLDDCQGDTCTIYCGHNCAAELVGGAEVGDSAPTSGAGTVARDAMVAGGVVMTGFAALAI